MQRFNTTQLRIQKLNTNNVSLIVQHDQKDT